MFSREFGKICQNPFFFQNTSGRLLLIIAVSIVVKGQLANEAVNYDKKAKAYVMKQSPRGVPWNSVLRNFTKLTEKYLGLPGTLLKNRLWHRCFPVNFVKFLRILFLTEDLWWLLLYVPIWARSVSYLKRAVLVKFEQVSEAVVHKFSSKLVFLKISVKHLCWRHFFIKLIKKRLQLC